MDVFEIPISGEQILRMLHLKYVLFIFDIYSANQHIQILDVELCTTVAQYIRDQIEELDTWNNCQPLEDLDEVSESLSCLADLHVSLGSKQKRLSFQALEDLNNTNIVFQGFRKKLIKFFKGLSFTIDASSLTPETLVCLYCLILCQVLILSLQITPFNFLKIIYESKVDWKAYTDYLRCSPSFHGQERYDFVLVDTVDGEIFARLLFIFICKVDDTEYPLALIHPHDEPIEKYPEKDADLGFYRVQATSQKKSEFIFLDSMIRGALVVEDYDTENQFFVVDVVDSDMFLRMQELLASGMISSDSEQLSVNLHNFFLYTVGPGDVI